MEIVICTDKNYLMPAGVLICSVCENNKDENINFHIISDKKSDYVESSLKREVNNYHQNIYFYYIEGDTSFLPVKLKGQPQHITIASYYRLFIASILPINIDKVLYLDCDIIVRHSLLELWNTELNNYAIACVTDGSGDLITYYNRLRYNSSLGYFNAGVLLINLKYWRENNIQEEFIDYIKDYPERLKFHDQDVLNFVLRNNKKKLPLKFNVQDSILLKELYISWEYENELNDAISNPYIIHYCGTFKPWFKECNNPYKEIFFTYRNLTEWKDMPLLRKRKFKSMIKSKIRFFLESLGIVSKNIYNEYRSDIKLN